jgi:hypothetical protein
MSLALVGSEEPHTTSGALLRESRPALVIPSAVRPAEWERMDALPSPAMRAAPSLSTKMFA